MTSTLPTSRQRRQRKLYLALGYSIGIRGYIHCLRSLMKAAGFKDSDLPQIEAFLQATKRYELYIRVELQNIK